MTTPVCRCRRLALALLGLGAMSAHAVTYSIDAPSFTAGGPPNEDDLFNPGPVPALAIPGIGAPGIEVNAMSYGRSLLPSDDVEVYFSVTQSSIGAPGTAVNLEGIFADHPADIFVSTLQGTNFQFRDGDGLIANPLTPGAPSPALGLIEPIPAFPFGDNLDALDLRLGPVPLLGLGPSVFWSVDAATAAGFPAYAGLSSADVFWSPPLAGYSGAPAIYAPAPLLGLMFGDDIDGMVWFEDDTGGVPTPGPSPGDLMIFSLTPGSPTLAQLGYVPGTGGADLFFVRPGGAVGLFAPAGALGLLPTDDIDGLDVVPEPRVLALFCLCTLSMMLRRRRS
jgi:hypothetical protein